MFGYQFAIDRVKLFLENADISAKMLYFFKLGDPGRIARKWDALSLAEESDFIRASYRVKTLVTLIDDTSVTLPSRMLSFWSLVELWKVMSVLYWVLYECSRCELGDIGASCEGASCLGLVLAGVTYEEVWIEVFNSIDSLKKDLCVLTTESDRCHVYEITYFYTSDRDSYGHECKVNKGTLLAGLLVLVREQGILYKSGDYKLSDA